MVLWHMGLGYLRLWNLGLWPLLSEFIHLHWWGNLLWNKQNILLLTEKSLLPNCNLVPRFSHHTAPWSKQGETLPGWVWSHATLIIENIREGTLQSGNWLCWALSNSKYCAVLWPTLLSLQAKISNSTYSIVLEKCIAFQQSLKKSWTKINMIFVIKKLALQIK